jgi:hypothetical protein
MLACGRAGVYDWLQFNGDCRHSGHNTEEAILHRGNVAGLSMLYQVALPDAAGGRPYVTAEAGTLTANGLLPRLRPRVKGRRA